MRHQIYFSDETSQKLRNYVKAKYGKHRALSLVVQQAVDEFLKSEKDRGAWIEEEKQPRCEKTCGNRSFWGN